MTPRVPPHSMEAERGVLNAVLLDSDAYDLVADHLHARDWYSESHQQIWEALGALRGRGSGIDTTTLREELVARQRLQAVGGDEYLIELTNTIPVVAHVEEYAKIIRDRAVLRELITTCHRIAGEAYDGVPDNVLDFIDRAEARVMAVTQARRASETNEHIASIARRTYAAINDAATSGGVTGTKTGFRVVDEMTLGLAAGDLVIVAARPGMGKTAFAMNVARNVAQSEGPVQVFSLEMPRDQLVRRLQAAEGRIDGTRIRSGQLWKEDWPRLARATGELAELPIFIDDQPGITPLQVRARCRRTRSSQGALALVVVDYLQLLKPVRRNDTRERDVADMTASMKELAKELACPVLLLAQLNRDLEKRKDKRPVLSDLRESGAVEQDADTILFLYRHEYYHPNDNDSKNLAEIIIGKQRSGPTGSVRCAFFPEYTRFDNLAEDDYDAADFSDEAPPPGVDWSARAAEAAAQREGA